MFVDASAIVAVMSEEPNARELADVLDTASDPITSSLAVFETVVALARKKRQSVHVLMSDVQEFLADSGIKVRPISEEAGYLALEAHARYGKGGGNPASLNLGDCFAYAMARQHGVALLYTGDDFARTDLG